MVPGPERPPQIEDEVPEPVTVTVSWSEISAWRTCPMRHWLSYRQRQDGKPSGHAAVVGTIWHEMMQDWYRGRLNGVALDELAWSVPGQHTTWEVTSEAEQEVVSTLLWMWDGFLLNGDPFLDYEVRHAEDTVLVDLPRVPGQPDHVTFVLKIKIDLMLARAGRLAVVDHKSQAKKTEPETLSRDMDMDDQLGLYLWATRQLETVPARRIAACWSYAVTTDLKKEPRPPADRYWLAWSARTDTELDRIAIEATESAMDAYARPAHIEPPRSPDKEVCRWRCDHRDRCYYARSANRPVELGQSYKPDQAPEGITRERWQ